jgi:hypothetical protein
MKCDMFHLFDIVLRKELEGKSFCFLLRTFQCSLMNVTS